MLWIGLLDLLLISDGDCLILYPKPTNHLVNIEPFSLSLSNSTINFTYALNFS